jgi:hypothetical protein
MWTEACEYCKSSYLYGSELKCNCGYLMYKATENCPGYECDKEAIEEATNA